MRNYLYACSFSLGGAGGKSRATRQKLAALEVQVGSLCVVSLPKSVLVGLLFLPFFELYICWLLIVKNIEVFISRGYLGFFSLYFARLLGIKTVREIHADPFGEMDLQRYSKSSGFIAGVLNNIQVSLDNCAHTRIFNHPELLQWWVSKYGRSECDEYVYNGAEIGFTKDVDFNGLRQSCDLNKNDVALVFVGTASVWHGVDYLVDLQREFNTCSDPYRIVCAGGRVPSEIDPEGLLINVTPLDDEGCSNFIRMAEAVLLPVKLTRVSPGSPLKLYDYLAHSALIITQEGVVGYSDEVERYEAGFAVDFSNPKQARAVIVGSLAAGEKRYEMPENISWFSRMKSWIEVIDRPRIV